MLEKSIEAWRNAIRQAAHQGPPAQLSEETIDELESHLRDAVADLVQNGLTEDQAFERATKELGSIGGLAREFQKMDEGLWLPIKFAVGVALLGVAAGLLTLILNLDSPGIRFLLASHVVLVTLGYSMTFLIGALGICCVGQRSFSGFPRQQLRQLARATFAFGCVAAIMTISAVLLGAFWANAAWGRYWGWDIKEVSGLAVILWQLIFVAAHWLARRHQQGEQVLVPMSILGNVVVGMAWFGSFLLTAPQPYGPPYWIPLLAALALHAVIFIAAFAPPGCLRRSKTI